MWRRSFLELDPTACIPCGNCLAICSCALIRMKVYEEKDLAGAPATFKSAAAGALTKKFGSKVTIQVAPEDCMGCELCVVQCAMKRFRCAAAFFDIILLK